LDYQDEIAEIRKQQKQLAKREQELKLRKAAEKDMDKWKALTELKHRFQEELKESEYSVGMNLSKLASMADYYEYQNPKNPTQKSFSKESTWVSNYSQRGDVADLIEKAKATRHQAYMKMMNKGKKAASKTKPKSNDIGAAGGQSKRGSRGISH
tara:strand:+ start:1248 stop:1709 length:462 start_codon:yes stop_codon:yes gene_type:complete